jgi:hypothetical protein
MGHGEIQRQQAGLLIRKSVKQMNYLLLTAYRLLLTVDYYRNKKIDG